MIWGDTFSLTWHHASRINSCAGSIFVGEKRHDRSKRNSISKRPTGWFWGNVFSDRLWPNPAEGRRGSALPIAAARSEEIQSARKLPLVRGSTRPQAAGRVSPKRPFADFRGRDAHYWAPPAQIRTCPIRAYGSYLGCLTAKRLSGHGWRIRGFGSHSSIRRFIRAQLRAASPP